MSEKRRDRKGRLLKRGERQNRDGRYEYRYYDIQGVRRSVYSWRLVETDTIPRGKRHKPPLQRIGAADPAGPGGWHSAIRSQADDIERPV